MNFKNRIVLLLISFFMLSISCWGQNPGDAFFKSSLIHDVHINIMSPSNWWDSLQYYHLNGDSVYMKADVKIDGYTLPKKVGVKLKGNSSYGYPGTKKPIKISFDEFDDNQTYDQLKKLNFSNNMLDPTHMREKLYMDFLNSNGFVAPRCTYSRVFYNNQFVGIYKTIEQVDKTFLKTRYGNKGGNLYKGDPAGMLTWRGPAQNLYFSSYELKTNETENNWSDLVRLIDKINNTPGLSFRDSLEKVLNTKAFIHHWAAENLFVDLDKYYHNAHNYYLYQNTETEKFEYVPWDMSVVFGFFPFMFEPQKSTLNILHVANPSMMGPRPLATRMLQDPVYRSEYLNAICKYLDYMNPTYLFPKIDSIANRIRPDIYTEPNSNKMFPEFIFELSLDSLDFKMNNIGDIPGLKRFITNRRKSVMSQLSAMGINCSGLSSVKEEVENSFKIYPNPMYQETRIEFEKPIQNASMSVYNTMGILVKQILNVSGKTIIIHRENLPFGLYYVHLTEKNKTIGVQKLIIYGT